MLRAQRRMPRGSGCRVGGVQEHGGGRQQTIDGVLVRCDEALLAGVEPREKRAFTIFRQQRRGIPKRVPTRRLELDHVCAEVREQLSAIAHRGEGALLQDPHAFEGRAHESAPREVAGLGSSDSPFANHSAGWGRCAGRSGSIMGFLSIQADAAGYFSANGLTGGPKALVNSSGGAASRKAPRAAVSRN